MSSASAPAPETAATSLEFRILGPMEVLRDGVPVDLGPRRHRALLALLLLDANRVLSSDRLVEELWPESEGDKAKHSFESTLSRLRKLLDVDQALVLHNGRLTLDLRRCWIDAVAFERLLDHMRKQDGVWITRRIDIARHWIATHPYPGHGLNETPRGKSAAKGR